MKKIMATDGALKVVSVIIAVGIWIYIALVVNPAIEVTVRDLPIQFIGQDVLAENDLAVISESVTTVNVKVMGSRKKMGNNDMSTIIARADLSGVTEAGEAIIPIEISIPFENQGISSQSDYNVTVKTEARIQKEIGVEVNTVGTLASNYMPGDIKVKPSKITISGPRSAVDKISKAAATLNYGGADLDIDTSSDIVFYDADGKEISSLDAIMGRITPSQNNVDIHCPVLKMHKVSVKANFGGEELPDGFSYNTEPSEVYIFGDEKTAANVKEIKTETIPVDRLYDNGKVKVKLSVPWGVRVFGDITEAEISVNK